MPIEDSELEKEFELEMEKDEGAKDEEIKEEELERELELEMEKDEEAKDEELEFEEREPEEREFEEKIAGYTDRLFEISEREYESESELDTEIDNFLNEMERDFFFKGLWKKIKDGGKKLIKTGIGLAKNLPIMQVVKGVTSLARGNLKGMLKPFLKTAIGMIPGIGPVASTLSGPLIDMVGSKFGFEVTQDTEKNKAQLEKAVRITAAAYDNLARNLGKNATDPKEASRLAASSFQNSLDKIQAQIPVSLKKGYRIIKIRRGDRIMIKGV